MPLGQTTAANSTPVVLASDVPMVTTPSAMNSNTAALITAVGATTTQTSADQTNTGCRGLMLVCDVTALTTGAIAVSIQGKDAASGKYYTILTGASLVAVATTMYQIYPSSTSSSVAYNGPLPTTWRVVVTAVNAFPTTYTIGAALLG